MLAQWLVKGKPELGWRGDPRLSLHIGVLVAAKNGTRAGKHYRKGDVVAFRYEVHRHNEDGTDTEILHRAAAQWHEIIPALIDIDPRTPGFKPTMDKVEAANKIEHREAEYAMEQAYGEANEHLWNIVREREGGKTFFGQVQGSKDA